jgi:hypothetical protein
MDIRDQALLEQLRQMLTQKVSQNQGVLWAPDVIVASRDLDKMVLRFMQKERNDPKCRV